MGSFKVISINGRLVLELPTDLLQALDLKEGDLLTGALQAALPDTVSQATDAIMQQYAPVFSRLADYDRQR